MTTPYTSSPKVHAGLSDVWFQIRTRFGFDARRPVRARRAVETVRTPSEAVAIMRALTPKMKAEAKERQRAGLKHGDEPPRSGNFPERGKGDARERVARIIGKSYGYRSEHPASAYSHRTASCLICSKPRIDCDSSPFRTIIAASRSSGSNAIALATAERSFITPWLAKTTISSGSRPHPDRGLAQLAQNRAPTIGRSMS